jgi:hypothetical protein
MKYFVYFDAYGHARQFITEQQLAENYDNEPSEFLSAMCRKRPDPYKDRITGHVGTLCFDTEKELIDYLAQLGEEIEGFYGCHSESRPYNF